MTVTAHYTRPDEGARLDMPDGVYIVKASAEETGRAFEVFEVKAPAIPSGPLHRSPWAATIYLLEGNLVIRFEDEQVSLSRQQPCNRENRAPCRRNLFSRSRLNAAACTPTAQSDRFETHLALRNDQVLSSSTGPETRRSCAASRARGCQTGSCSRCLGEISTAAKYSNATAIHRCSASLGLTYRASTRLSAAHAVSLQARG
jgi:hypothetical protein